MRGLRLVSAVLAGAALILSSSCGNPCGYEVVSQYPSPDGRLKAVIFVQGCGATVRDVTEFSILTANADAPKGPGNALVIRDDPAHPVQESPDGIELRVKWNSSSSISVLFPQAAVVEKRSTGVNGVNIEYGTF